jgi:Fe-S-cluster containining protein
MKNNLQIENLEKAFYHDGFQLGMKAIQSGASAKQIFESLKELYEAIDNMTDALFALAQKQEQPIACRKGCEWCCHQPVFALDYELEYLAHFIKNNFSELEKTEIKTRAGIKNRKFSQLKNEDLLNAKHPCPLLKNGACLAYAARPVACRIYLSSKLESCLKFFREPEDKNSYPALLDLPMRAGRMMNEGFKSALKMNGLSISEYRIEEKLLV